MERSSKLKIGVLTSSRADYGIYLPLIKEMKKEDKIDFQIIAFGTHLSPYHGYTIDNIMKDGFAVDHKIESLLIGDSEEGISSSMGLTTLKFAQFWEKYGKNYDIVLALGDRFEMFSAVAASIPFNMIIAHIHGGEETVGAIDNKFRHSITFMSKIHFTSHDLYRKRIIKMLNNPDYVYTVGALSLDNLKQIELLDKDSFKLKYNIDITIPSVLVTMHPETVALSMNKKYAQILGDTLFHLSDKYQIIITMPNADTEGNIYRHKFIELKEILNERIKIIENFGTLGYFSCMKLSNFLIGNSSSGIIEASSLQKWVINLGDRQRGRICGENVINSQIEKSSILKKINLIESKPKNMSFTNPYYHGGASHKIINYLLSYAGLGETFNK